ncbi:AfsR/SARP family transcriptional regulator [Actinoplanes missouriensis]|uniref:AfsR/SARP family transcriptional regulator n=1 Tax=Actinoplanes missouriensis TaxID=1866 RepID=UPI00059F10B9|nr:BTAD domain-containing putative transcriptional regulator [Actinoplanes missouriensis]
MGRIRFGVLGPVTAEDARGEPIALKGPMHRAVLGRLLVARRRVVPVSSLVDDLWVVPPDGPVAAVRTFVAALRRAVEPGRLPRTPPVLLVTRGQGYALLADPGDVDAWRFEQVVTAAATMAPGVALGALDEALSWWRGPAYADFPDAAWPRADRSRLTELRLQAVERRAQARLDLGRAAEAVPDLDEHVTAHPWRENGWRLLALALYRAGRQGDALAVLRRARELLAGQLGVDPGAALRTLETAILQQDPALDPPSSPTGGGEGTAEAVWARAASAYDRVLSGGSRVRLESAVGLLRNLAVTGPGGLEIAREQRAAAVAAAERALAVLPRAGHEPARTRLLATIAVESRGTHDPRPLDCARQAERMARGLDDPALLAFALNGVFMQSFRRTGGAARRDAVGAELVALASRHGLVTAEVLGHLIRMQAGCAVVAFDAADRHADAADRLAQRHELPLAGVFTEWYRALRADVAEETPDPEPAYRAAAARLDRAGMPGMRDGLLPLVLLGTRLRRGLPLTSPHDPAGDARRGPYEPWARLVLDPRSTGPAGIPDPPADLLAEALWCLYARAAIAAADVPAMARAREALLPASAEWAGAASGVLTLGPVSDQIAALDDALRRD